MAATGERDGAVRVPSANMMAPTRGIVTGPDGNLWFTDYNTAGTYGRITPSGKVTIFSRGLTNTSYPYDIKPGPRKTLWLTELVSNRIGKLLI